jgi:hypothetical protein
VCRWAVLLPRQGGGRTNESFDDDFFVWLSRQILVIEDYPYAGIDFLRDLEIPIPPGEKGGEMGKSPPLYFFFVLNICNFYVFLLYISFFFVMPEYLTDMCLLCVDVGLV